LIKKITVAWLLSLFVWNVALAGVPSVLLCLHHDFAVHLETEGAEHGHCDDVHDHVESQETELCVVKDDCTDLELQGGEQIPSRLNEVHSVDLPILSVAEFNFHDSDVRKIETLSTLLSQLRGPPPSVHWLTDYYIQKTVLRV
tara:strand:- start:6309 stop:6737 length:429 start_codon:yes stop_codon:yes gene_type:complete